MTVTPAHPPRPLAAQADAPLLRTKLLAPPRRPGLVPRPRLAERIAGPGAAALTLVSAAAGFGKTTLVAESLRDHPAMAWLSLDQRDDDPTLFWTYVVAALQTVEPGVGAGSLSALRAPEPSIDAAVALLINDLNAVSRDMVLVLDDYHVITSERIHEAMAFLVAHPPPQLRIVLATRADPPLPLAGLRAGGALAEIRAADLRFHADEAADYLTTATDLALTPADIGALESRTEGWIAALQLAALSLRGRDDAAAFIATFAGDDRFILDYLAGEVLERQSEELRGFLLETSILGRLTGPLCDAVTGRGDGRSTLEHLERANMFIVPLDGRRVWYRYHHLFADVLRARLLDEQPERIAALHRRAGEWHERSGDLPDAIHHALAGGDADRAAGLIERAMPAMQRARREATLRRWFDALPDEVFPARPVLAMGRIGARMASGDFEGVEALLGGVERWLEDAAGRPQETIVVDQDALRALPAQVAVYRAALALVAGDAAATIAHADRAFELTGGDDHLRRGSAAALVGLARWSLGDLEIADRRYAEAIVSLERAGHASDALGCRLALADIQAGRGRLGAAIRTLEAGLRPAGELGPLRGTADMHVGLGELLLERGDLDGAARHLRASRELGEQAALPQHPYRSRVAMARLLQAQGDPAGALELLDEAEPLFDSDFSPPIRPVPAVAARIRLQTGDVAAALRWAHGRGLDARDELSYLREFEHITLARALLAHRAGDSAQELLRRLLAAAEDGERTGSVVELLVLRSLADLGGGDAAAARASLAAALIRAEPEGYVRVFLDEGAPVIDLLRSAALHGQARGEARRVLSHLPPGDGDAAATPRAGTGPVEELSSRERDVLRLLRSDLSGPDIARELVVSLNTVRTHTKNIYAKLGVNNRRAAVRRAAELGL